MGHEWQQEYDDRGHLVQATDPLGRTTRYRHDARGRTVEVIDVKGGSKHLAWDEADRLVAYTDCSGQTTRFAYDALGQPVLRTDALGQQTRYEYNDAGQRIRAIEPSSPRQPAHHPHPGKVTCFERDALGRLLAKRALGHTGPVQETTYRYDALGRLNQAGNAASHLAFAYDPVGQLLSETQTLQTLGGTASPARHKLQRSLSHGYDELGNRTHTRMPDGRTLHWLFYGSGHLHQINIEPVQAPGQPQATHQVIADMERDALHREVRRSQGALSSRYDGDPAGRLLRHRAELQGSGHVVRPGSSNATLERGYAYDAPGHPLRVRPPGPTCLQKRCLRQHPLPVGWRPHGAQPAWRKTGALHLRAGELCAAGHRAGCERRAQYLLVPMRPDRRATGVDRRTRLFYTAK